MFSEKTRLGRRSFLRAATCGTLAPWPSELHLTSASDGRIRVAILGTGHAHAQGKLQVLRQLPDYEVIGVCEPDEVLRRKSKLASAFAGIQWLEFKELLGNKSIQLVAIEGRVRENLEYAKSAIRAGKHIHLDKPPGTDLESLRALLKEARNRGVLVQMGYQWRYNPAFQAAIEAARRGWLGTIYQVRGNVNSQINEEYRKELATYRGGMMFELGCHLIDRMVDLLGKPKAVQSWLRHDSSFADSLEDNTLAVFEFENAIATIYSSALQPLSSPHRSFEILGTKGSAIVQPYEPPGLKLGLEKAAGPYRQGWQQIEFSEGYRYVSDFKELASAIRSSGQLSYSSEHDLIAQETLLRACGGS